MCLDVFSSSFICVFRFCITSLTFVFSLFFFFLMIRRPPRSTLDRSSAASDVYKRQVYYPVVCAEEFVTFDVKLDRLLEKKRGLSGDMLNGTGNILPNEFEDVIGVGKDAVSYTHLRAHETVLDLVCRLLLETKNTNTRTTNSRSDIYYKNHIAT